MIQRIKNKQIRAVLFDCDGVVINSGEDIADAVNKTLDHFNLKCLSYNSLLTYVGDGARMLIVRALTESCNLKNANGNNLTESDITEILNWYLNYYYSHSVIKTTLYPGFESALKSLYEIGTRIGIVTNKPSAILQEILEHFGIAKYFDAPIGSDQVLNLKPSPEGLELALKKINEKILKEIEENATSNLRGSSNFIPIKPSEVLMVGDSAVDIMAGKSFGAFTCGVLKGIGNQARLLEQNPDFTVGFAGEVASAIIFANKILSKN